MPICDEEPWEELEWDDECEWFFPHAFGLDGLDGLEAYGLFGSYAELELDFFLPPARGALTSDGACEPWLDERPWSGRSAAKSCVRMGVEVFVNGAEEGFVNGAEEGRGVGARVRGVACTARRDTRSAHLALFELRQIRRAGVVAVRAEGGQRLQVRHARHLMAVVRVHRRGGRLALAATSRHRRRAPHTRVRHLLHSGVPHRCRIIP